MLQSPFPKKVGILGGGQLARMLAVSCYSLGLTPFIFCKSKTDSAAQVVGELFHDSGRVDSLLDFASRVDLVIIENEFVNLDNLRMLEEKTALYPSVACLQLIQNKLEQKKNLLRFGLPTAPFCEVNNVDQLERAVEEIGHKLVLKSATMGYDGKGTVFYDSKTTAAARFFNQNPLFQGYAEKFVNFKSELAVVVARSTEGKIEAFPPVETKQVDGICEWVVKPQFTAAVVKKAVHLAEKVIDNFGGTGVFGVEMFLTAKNEIIINEVAPRVHNSGHITMNGCNVSQFDQHLRAVLGAELVKPQWTSRGAAMMNIVGKETGPVSALQFEYDQVESGQYVYWYGKKGHSLKRKLGHINVVGSKSQDCLKAAQKLRGMLKV